MRFPRKPHIAFCRTTHFPGLMYPIWFTELPDTVNQRLPSGPAVIPPGALSAVDKGNSVMIPAGVIRPILPIPGSENQRLPSGPAVISLGWSSGAALSPVDWLLDEGVVNSVTVPVGVIRPILCPCCSANQRLPSGPTVIPKGSPELVGTENSVKVPVGVMRPIPPII